MSKFFVRCCFLRIVFVVLISIFLSSAERKSGEMTLSLPEIKCPVSRDADGKGVFGKYAVHGKTGEPMLPMQSIKILLPPFADLNSLKAKITDSTIKDIDGKWEIAPTPPAVPSSSANKIHSDDSNIVNGLDMDIYSKDKFFPESFIRYTLSGHMRLWKVVEVIISPYQFNPVTKQLRMLESANIVLTFDEKTKDASIPGSSIFIDNISEKWGSMFKDSFINFEDIAPEYRSNYKEPKSGNDSGISSDSLPGYAIITTDQIVNMSNKLSDFISSKQNLGYNVYIVTESDWGGSTGDIAAENLRSWLQSNYIPKNIEHVLLIGNPNPDTGNVPMKMTWPRYSYSTYREAPTDMYYAELTGNWDLNNDNIYGDYHNDYGLGGAERFCDLYLGRIPVYNGINNLDHILSKIIAYENAPINDIQWRRRALLPMKPMDSSTPSYQLGENIKDLILTPKGDWNSYRIYEENYGLIPVPESTPCTYDNVKNGWNLSPTGITAWLTHGSQTSASSVMNNTYAAMLNDTFPSLTFQASCLNSYPENPANLSYTLLVNGAVGTVGATRVSWYYIGQSDFTNSPSIGGMAYAYVNNMITDEFASGEALNNLKSSINPTSASMWMNWLVFNLYGDPSVSLYMGSQEPQDPCDNPIMINCNGYYYQHWGNYNATPEGICIRVHNDDYLNGTMFSVRNNGTNDSVIVEWYGVLDQNRSDCEDRCANLFGNGAQINNVCTPREGGYMYFRIRSKNDQTCSVRIEFTNWMNGPGCQ
ncbi:MAG: hypothetical protein GXY77_11810 [Fibrobacter sp.]|nr:hypothetical protein [Fibrobacter sp.]